MKYYEVQLYTDEIARSKRSDFFPFVCTLDTEQWDVGQRLLRGEPIADESFSISLRSVQDGRPDSRLSNDSDLLLFSDEVVSALSERGIKGIQTLPARILTLNGSLLRGYSTVANLTTKVHCLDLQKSTYTVYSESNPPPGSFPEWLGKPHVIRKLVVVGAQIAEGIDIFRLGERTNRILCSQRFVDVWTVKGFSNLSFEEVTMS